MKALIGAYIFLFLLIPAPLFAQDGSWYSLDADTVEIESDASGHRKIAADGNVTLQFDFNGEIWTLTSDYAEYSDVRNETNEFLSQLASASGNVSLSGNSIGITLPGRVDIDLFNGNLISSSSDIRLTFDQGKMLTDYLEIKRNNEISDSEQYHVLTDIRTELDYNLSEFVPLAEEIVAERSGNIFGDLQFQFSSLNIKTVRTSLAVIDGEPEKLTCPDYSVISSHGNKLSMPTFELSFHPRKLTGSSGVELLIGEENKITSAQIVIEYPDDGGMFISLDGTASLNLINSVLPPKVFIENPLATFSANRIAIKIGDDGTQSIEASGDTKFEMPLEGILEEMKSDSESNDS